MISLVLIVNGLLLFAQVFFFNKNENWKVITNHIHKHRINFFPCSLAVIKQDFQQRSLILSFFFGVHSVVLSQHPLFRCRRRPGAEIHYVSGRWWTPGVINLLGTVSISGGASSIPKKVTTVVWLGFLWQSWWSLFFCYSQFQLRASLIKLYGVLDLRTLCIFYWNS